MKTLKKFDIISRLGQGSFANVYKVKRKEDDKFYALKEVKSTEMKDRQIENCLNEVRILATMRTPFIVSYKEAFYDEDRHNLYLVTQFAEGGDLARKIGKARKREEMIDENSIWRIAIQLLHGMKQLHDINIFHRDIKPANILLGKDEQCAKLADMNVSKVSKTGMAKTQTGTPYYASPEVWTEKSYNSKSDIWSFGCVIYELAALKPPFTAPDFPSLRKKIVTGQFDRIPRKYSQDLDNFIRNCLVRDQKSRASAISLLQSDLIKKKTLLFKNEKYFHPCFLQNDEKPIMIQTIKANNRNFKSIQMKLPKCMYDSSQKENILDNKSWFESQKQKKKSFEKLPKISRANSASRNIPVLKINRQQHVCNRIPNIRIRC